MSHISVKSEQSTDEANDLLASLEALSVSGASQFLQKTGLTTISNGTVPAGYSDEEAQDAVGNAVGNGLDYDDATGSISVDETELTHNSLGGKQGGTAGEYYHLTAAKNTVVQNTSGTNTGDQNLFQTIAVSGQSNVVADSPTDTLTLVEGSNVTITTDPTTDSITIAASGGGGSPGGSTTQLQYNNAGAFGGIPGITYSSTTLTIASGTAITAPGAGSLSERFGAGALAAGDNSAAFGNTASSSGTNGLALGSNSQASQTNTTAIGTVAIASATSSTAIGASSQATASGAIAIGKSVVVSAANALAIGAGASATQGNNVALGASSLASVNNGVAVGASALATGVGGGCTAVGVNASASGASGEGATAVGFTTLSTGTSSVAVGTSCNATALRSLYVGADGTAAAQYSVALGYAASTTSGHTGSIAIGRQATTTAANQFVAGGTTTPISDVFFGKGVSNASPTAYTIHGTGGLGTDIAGANLYAAGGQGTGTGVGGSFIIQTAPAGSTGTSANALVDRVEVSQKGNVVLGSQSALATNATDGFTYIPTQAGAPSGTPTAYTGKVAMTYDTANNKLYIYNGAWKSVTLT